jgi:glycosyltransferase involved in cell wall biosynthesis
MRRRKVLYVARTAKGGSAFSLYHLVRGLGRRYEPVVLFYVQQHPYIGNRLAEFGVQTITLEKTRQGSSPALDQPVGRRDIGGWLGARFGKGASQVYVFLKVCYRFIRRDVPKIWPIVCAIRENGIDLVHLNTTLRSGKPGIIAAYLTRIPCICHIRVLGEAGRFERLFARFVDAFIYTSSAVAENYIAQGIPPAKGVVIHNAVDVTEFTRTYDAAQVRGEFGWTAQERLVGVIGRLDWWKGHEYFLEAMAEVARQVPNVRGLAVGSPENTPMNREYYRRLQSLTKSLGLEGKVIFTGFRDDVPRLMSALDVVVLSSAEPEPFGRVVIEGMAAGKPVVATAAGGVVDIIEDGVNGLLVPPRDSGAIAAAILEVLSDREKARQVGLAARRRVEEKFTVQHHAAAVQQMYDAILGAPRGRCARKAHQSVGDEASFKPLPGT